MQQPGAPAASALPDNEDHFRKRRRTALWFSVALFFLSMVILVVGLVSATRTGNVAVAGYYPGIVLSFGAFLGIVGINLVENRRPMLVASIVFVSFGVISSFFCAIVDGVIAAAFIDRRPLLENRCEFYGTGPSYNSDPYHTEVTCYSFNSKCKIRVKSNTCYCCDLYNCESPDYHSHYYEFTSVSGCYEVIHLYRLLWSSVVLNVIGLFLGIVTAAILGAFKDMACANQSAGQTASSPAPPPHIVYNPTQHVLTYGSYCPSNQGVLTYPNYPLPLQPHSGFQPASAPGPEAAASPSEESQPSSQAPSQASSSYMLTPNAPAFYGTSYSPFEKPPPPPPYAC